jgi:hypothetical protein
MFLAEYVAILISGVVVGGEKWTSWLRYFLTFFCARDLMLDILPPHFGFEEALFA